MHIQTNYQQTSPEIVVRCDGEPLKMMSLTHKCLGRYMGRLRRLYPDHSWSVSYRFPLGGGD